MPINYESAWEHLKQYVSDMESYSKPYNGNGFQAVLHKMEDLEKELTTEEPKDKSSTTISSILRKYNLLTDDTALPDVKIGDYTLERSKLPKFTAEDLKVAKDAFDASNQFIEVAKNFSRHSLYTDVVNQFADEKAKEVDKIVFDCFQEHLGCKKADDVFVIVTSPVMFHHYNDILPYINAKIAQEVGSFGSPSGECCIKLNELTEPAKGSREILETLRTRWEEVYNE